MTEDKIQVNVLEHRFDDYPPYVEFDIDELINILNKAKANGAVKVEISCTGDDACLDKIEAFYFRDKTPEEIELMRINEEKFQEWRKAHGFSTFKKYHP